MSFHICLTLVRGVLSLARNSFFRKNVDKCRWVAVPKSQLFLILGMNRVEIKRNGLRFGQNEAYGCQEAFQMPPEAQNTYNKLENIKQCRNSGI